jgi:succinoglycan biosynthesis transport protein ExoP
MSFGGYGRGAPGERNLAPTPIDERQLAPRAPIATAPFVDAFGVEEEAEPQLLDLLKYLHVAIKWRWLIAGCLLLGLAAGAASVLLTTPMYRAVATIQIDQEPAKIVALESQQTTTGGGGEEFYQTQYGLLRSRALARRVVDHLGLGEDPRFLNQSAKTPVGSIAPAQRRQTAAQRAAQAEHATDLLLGGLGVDPVPRSWLVRINYQSPDPVIAAKIANAVGENFIFANLEHRYEASAYARKFLEERLAIIRQKLEESERQLVAYAAKNQIIDAAGVPNPETGKETPGQSIAVTDLASVNTALMQAAGGRIQAEQRWREAEATPDLSLPEVIANGSIQGLIGARSALAADYQQKLATFKPDYPAMVEIRSRIATLDRQVADQARAIKDSMKNQYLVALRQEQSLAAVVQQQKGTVLDQRTRGIQYNILQREVDTNRSLYDGLLQRYKEIGVAGGVGTNNVAVVDAATVPSAPFKPQPLPALVRFAALGLGLGVLIAFLLEQLDVSIKIPEDVKKHLGVPLLGVVPETPKETTPLKALSDPKSPLSEAYYSIRTALQFSTRDGVPSSLLVTSAAPGEGKSTTAVALAGGFARLGLKVLLIDGDLRNPSLHRIMARENAIGLSNLLAAAGSEFAPALQPTNQPNLVFLSAGPIPPNPAELLSGEKMRNFVHAAKSEFDLVVIDGPPIMGLADAPLLADVVAATAMTVAAGATRRQQAKSAIHRLRMCRSVFVGVVLTRFDMRKAGYAYGHAHGYGYGYGYGYEYGASPTAVPRPRGLARLLRRPG